MIEAESFTANTARSGDEWELRSDLAGYAGTGFMRPEPANGNNIASNYATTSPQLDYRIEFPTTGTYYVWVRGWADDGAMDSVHVGLDGTAPDSGKQLVFDQDEWTWSPWIAAGPRATIDVTTAGVHTLNVWMREDGFRFDRILLTLDPDYTPEGAGPAESDPLPSWPQFFEAEDFRNTTDRSSHTWAAYTDDPAGFIGGSYLRAEPDSGSNIGSGYATTSPQLDYLVKFPAPGTYYVWVRGWADDGSSDSLHIGLDGVAQDSGKQLVFEEDEWAWTPWIAAGPRATLTVATAGLHTVNVWMREDGLSFDRFLITPDEDYEPTDIGPAETVVEAEDFVDNTPRSSRAWEHRDNFAGYGGTGFVRPEPTGGSSIGTGYATTSPQLDYQVNFPAAGTYYVWVRAWADDGASDSAHVGLDGVDVESGRWLYFDQDEWTWSQWTVAGPRTTLEVGSPGVHTANLWMREPGIRIDRLLFTPDEDYVPEDIGPAATLLPSAAIDIVYSSPGIGATRVTDSLGEETDFYFDAYARTTFVDYPGDEAGIFVFDAAGNLEKMVDAAEHETEFAYDANADVTTLTDPLGNPSNITYNAQHLPLTVTDANGHDWDFTYDTDGNVLTKTNPLDNTWTYTYDGEGNRETETTPLDRTWEYTYDADNNMTSKTDPLDHTWTYTYTTRGRKLTETDPNNHTSTWTWDRGDRITSMEDPAGATWTYDYDLIGELINSGDPAGKQTIWLYLGAIGLVYGRTDVLGNTWLYEYDDDGRMTLATDPLGHAIAYAYDDNGRMTSETLDHNPPGETDHLNIVTTYAYDESGRLISETLDPNPPGETDHLNRVTEYVYDDADRLIGKELPNEGAWTYGYDLVGNLTSVTDPLEFTTTYEYDAADRLVLETDPLGHRTKYVYDDDNRRTQVVVDPATDPDGVSYGVGHLNLTTTTVYDDADRIISIKDPLDHVTAYGYDDAGNQISITIDPGTSPHLNETTWFEYDELDRVVEITDPLGQRTTYDYDSRGRKTSETRGITATEPGITTAYDYDDLGQLLSVTVDPGSSPHVNSVTSFTYDVAGRRKTMTNPRGKTTTYDYDAADRLTEIKDALNGTVRFEYNPAGETTKVTNPRGKATTYEYDELGNILTETDPLDRERESVYNLAGYLTKYTDARGEETNYVYDDAGRLTHIRDDASNDLVIYAYDVANRQTGMTDDTGATGWDYDDASRVESVSSPQGTIGYTYDAADRRKTMTLPGSKTISYDYDAAGQLTDVTDWQSRTTSISYTSFGAVLGVVRPNGVESGYEYDTGGRLTAVEHADGATLLARFAYALDPKGNRTSLTSTGTAVTNQVEEYEYDDLDRLKEVVYDDGVNPVETIAYEYDANGNRETVTSGASVTDYDYDDADQLTSLSGATSLTFTYDLNGNRKTAGSDTFEYDWNDRLIEAEVGSTTVAYTYSGDDLRVTRQANGGTATPYLWDRESGLPEIVDDGTVAYVQLDDPGLVAEIDTSNDDAYPLPDALGTARLMTDDTATVAGTSDYDAFGNARATSGTQTELGWDGELRDPATGLTYLRARDLDPLTGRFLQQDWIQPNAPGTQGYNRYAYAANNPVTFTDPTGHDVEIALELQALVAVYDAYQGAVAIVRNINKLPPVARGLVAAVLGFTIGILRTVIAMLVMNIVIDTMGVLIKNSILGRALTLRKLTQVFRTAREVIDACASKYRLCKLLPKLLPKLPCVIDVARTSSDVYGDYQDGGVSWEDAGSYSVQAIDAIQSCRTGRPEGKGDGGDTGGSCAPNSFDGSTPVLMADGSEKRIDAVAVGDEVWAADPATGESGPREVTAVIVGTGTKDLVDVTVRTGDNLATITATGEHPFWVAAVGRWVAAAALVVGMVLATADGGTAEVAATHAYAAPHRVYNLTVEDLHTYFVVVGGEAVLVHNDDDKFKGQASRAEKEAWPGQASAAWGLNPDGEKALHDRIHGQDLTRDQIFDEAEELSKIPKYTETHHKGRRKGQDKWRCD